MDELELARRFYAEELQAACGLDPGPLVNAFASVPRERFLGPGPWRLCVMDGTGVGFKYHTTPDDNPRHVYHNVPIAIDESRVLNNGQPGTLAAWIQNLNPVAGETIVHIGCGTGYYSAILAEVAGASGLVTAVEVDPELAARARDNLSGYPGTTAIQGDGSVLDVSADAILVNAGATHALPAWLEALKDGGRMLLPLTFDMGTGAAGKGSVLRIVRDGYRFKAGFAGMVAIYPCTSARDPQMNQTLQRAFMQWQLGQVQSIRTEAHEPGPTCWAHREGFCVSKDPVELRTV